MAIKEGWEYAPLGSNSFHLTEGLFDFARRRRYVRRLINETPGARAVFRFTEKKDKSSEDEEKKQQVPCVHLEFKGNIVCIIDYCFNPSIITEKNIATF